MTADDVALLTAVIAAPDDDVPRLVYADYLDDRGRADRAAFIRVQVEHARKLANSEPDCAELARRAEEFLPAAVAADGWLAPVGGAKPFHRGFVRTVRSAGTTAAPFAFALLRCAPLREVVFEYTSRTPRPSERVSAAILNRVEAVDRPPLYTRYPQATAGVTRLVADCTPACPADRVIELLARQAGVVRPELVLNLWGCRLHEAGARWLCESPAFDRLTAVLLNPKLCRLPPTLVRRLRQKFGDRFVL